MPTQSECTIICGNFYFSPKSQFYVFLLLQKPYLLQGVEYEGGAFSFPIKPATSKCIVVVCYLSIIDYSIYRYPEEYLCIYNQSKFFP